MRNVLRALRTLAGDGDKVIALPVHLNPQVRGDVIKYLGDAPNVHLLSPLQYPDFVYLLNRAWAVVTDSGGVQEEAPTFGLQILITRESTERPEVVKAGFGRLVGSDYNAIVDGVRKLTDGSERKLINAPNPFGRGDAAERIAARIMKRSCSASRPLHEPPAEDERKAMSNQLQASQVKWKRLRKLVLTAALRRIGAGGFAVYALAGGAVMLDADGLVTRQTRGGRLALAGCAHP